MGHNHADEDINKSKIKYEIERGKRWWNSALEGDAWNITAYKLLPDLYRYPFVVDDHVP